MKASVGKKKSYTEHRPAPPNGNLWFHAERFKSNYYSPPCSNRPGSNMSGSDQN